VSEQKNKLITLAVLGGTGKEGSGLALRWAHAGYKVIIGSREAEKAQASVAELNALLGGEYLIGADNVTAASQADVVILSVPYSAQKATLESVKEQLQGKILVDVTVPLAPPKVRQVNVPSGLAATLEASKLLGEGVKVIAAFQNISAVHLKDLEHSIDCDVLVCGDDENAKEEVLKLVTAAGMRGLDAGPLANAVAVEALTPVLLYINKRYQVVGSGIRITGLA
jgi:NADPH-dependent F420 reductase